jgi:Flp pilus assembly protein TadD
MMRRLPKATLAFVAASFLTAIGPSAQAYQGDVGGGGYAKGIEALKAKHYREAAALFGELTDAAPRDPKAWQLLGAAYAGAANWKASRKAYERAVALAPEDVSAHAGLNLALTTLKDPTAQAETDWLKAKAQACNDTCPDAARFKALQASGMLQPG